ncbi:MAG: AAA family ATPase [Gemmatimonadaceae bacterium]|nr:AAA family ATPase [Gemmatimonadaceae bacterium]
MSTFQKATRKQIKIKIGVTGPTGSGKTFGSLRLAKGLAAGGKIAFIDTENESASLYSGSVNDHEGRAHAFDFDVINIAPPFTHDKFINAIEAAVKEQYQVVVIDSGSHFWEGILDRKSKLDAQGGNSFSNWAKVTDDYKDILAAVLQSPIHVICCLRSKMDYILEEVERNGRKTSVPKKVGLAPVMRDGVEYEFTTVFDVALDHNAACSKDRTSLFTGKIAQLTEDTGAAILSWLSTGAPVNRPSTRAAPLITADAKGRAIAAKDRLKNLDAAAAGVARDLWTKFDGKWAEMAEAMEAALAERES